MGICFKKIHIICCSYNYEFLPKRGSAVANPTTTKRANKKKVDLNAIFVWFGFGYFCGSVSNYDF